MAQLSPPPILVTGVHRSGTTWVGRMLTMSRDAVYVHEPLNPHCSQHLLGLELEHQYTYLTEDNEEPVLEAYHRLLELPFSIARDVRIPRDRWRRYTRLAHARLTGARPLLKDPFALFSIPWFVDRLGADVVVVVRSPAGVVGSTKRLGWGFDTRFLVRQPRLMSERLEAERKALEEPPTNIVEQVAVLWRVAYATAAAYARELPQVRVVRHEDLSLDPLGGFARLYDSLGLGFDRRARRWVKRTSRAGNPPESPPGRSRMRLDSRANLDAWKTRLTEGELERIERQTAEVARLFYS